MIRAAVVVMILCTSYSYQLMCQNGNPSFIAEVNGDFNIVSFVSFNETFIPEGVVRLHLKLRYFAGRQIRLRRCSRIIGFMAFNVCGDQDILIKTLLDLLLDSLGSKAGNNAIAVVSYLPRTLTNLLGEMLISTGIPYLAYTEDVITEDFLALSTYNLLQEDLLEVHSQIQFVEASHVLLLIMQSGTAQRLTYHHREYFWNLLKEKQQLSITKFDLDSRNETMIRQFVSMLKDDDEIRVIIAWSDFEGRKRLISHVNNTSDRLWYWYSETTFDNNFNHDINPISLWTHVFRFNPIFSYQSLNKRFTYSTMSKWIYKSTFQKVLNDAWIKQFKIQTLFQNKSSSLNLSSPSDVAVSQDFISEFDETDSVFSEVVESMLLPLWWSQPFKYICYRNGLYSTRYRVHYLSRKKVVSVYNGTKRYFHETPLLLLHYLKGLASSTVNSNHSIKCHPGYEPFMVEQNISSKHIIFTWDCLFCKDGFIKEQYNDQSCYTCPIFFIPNQNKTKCIDPYSVVYMDYSRLETKIFILVNFLSGMFTFFTMLCFLIKRQTPIVKSSDFKFAMTQIVSHIAISIALPIMFVRKASFYSCILQLCVPGFLLILINAITLLKSQKLLSVFQMKQKVSKKEACSRERTEYSLLFSFEAVFSMIVVIMYWYIPIRALKKRYVNTLTWEYYCSTAVHFKGLMLLLLLPISVCFVQCFRARSLPKNLNESKRLLYSAFIKVIVIGVYFPINYGQQTKLDETLVNMMVLSILNTLDIFFNYFEKVYIILFKPSKNTKAVFNQTIFDSINRHALKKKFNSGKN